MAEKGTKKRARKFLRLLQRQLSQQLTPASEGQDWIEKRFQAAIDSLPESEAKLKATLLAKKSRNVRLLRKKVFFTKETQSLPQTSKSAGSTLKASSSSLPVKRTRRSWDVAVSKLLDDHQCSIHILQNYLESISGCECAAISVTEPTSDSAEQFLSNMQVLFGYQCIAACTNQNKIRILLLMHTNAMLIASTKRVGREIQISFPAIGVSLQRARICTNQRCW